MSNKVLVEILVPAAGRSYDVWIPLESRMGEVTRMVIQALSELTAGEYKASADAVLCDSQSGSMYDVNTEIAELGIRNGSRLMLI